MAVMCLGLFTTFGRNTPLLFYSTLYSVGPSSWYNLNILLLTKASSRDRGISNSKKNIGVLNLQGSNLSPSQSASGQLAGSVRFKSSNERASTYTASKRKVAVAIEDTAPIQSQQQQRVCDATHDNNHNRVRAFRSAKSLTATNTMNSNASTDETLEVIEIDNIRTTGVIITTGVPATIACECDKLGMHTVNHVKMLAVRPHCSLVLFISTRATVSSSISCSAQLSRRVIITGTNFLQPTVVDYSTPSTDITAAAEAAAVVQVKFGEVWTSDCKVISDTEIEALAPPRAQFGWVNVVVAVNIKAEYSATAAATATTTGSTAANVLLSSDSDSSSQHSAL
eukprot:18449-Heterococcus_DN1.PRE.1